MLGEIWAGASTAHGRRWLSTWGSVVGYCVLIFVLSAQSNLQLPGTLLPSDKLAHLLEYAGLGWLWVRAITGSRPEWTTVAGLFSAVLFAGIYGISDEWHQYYVPGRHADLRDLFADVIGAMLGGLGYFLWRWSAFPFRRGQ